MVEVGFKGGGGGGCNGIVLRQEAREVRIRDNLKSHQKRRETDGATPS